MIDYEEFSSAVGLNWYEVDPNLQQTMRRMLAPQDLEWAEPELYRLGALIGGKVAASAEVIDKNPPRLVQYDRSGERIDQIVHHPATLEVKRALWEAGASGHRDAVRGRNDQRRNHAGQTLRAARAARKVARPALRRRFQPGRRRRDVFDRAHRRLRPRRAYDRGTLRRRAMVALGREMVLLQRRRRAYRHARPAARRTSRNQGCGALFGAPPSR